MGAHACNAPWRKAAFAVLLIGVLFGLVLGASQPARAGPTDKVYWTTSAGVWRGDLDGANIEQLASGSPLDLHIDPVADKLYWINSGTEIRRADLDGSNVETIASGLIGAGRLAQDFVAGKLYWTEQPVPNTQWRIARSNLDGSGQEDVLVLAEPFGGIAVDGLRGKLYWNLPKALRRADLDGSNVTTLAGSQIPLDAYVVTTYQDVSLDIVNNKLYWVTITHIYAPQISEDVGRVGRINAVGGGRQEIVFDPRTPKGVHVDPVSAKVYWIDNGTQIGGLTFGDSRIRRANLDGSASEHVLEPGFPVRPGIMLDAALPTIDTPTPTPAVTPVPVGGAALDGSLAPLPAEGSNTWRALWVAFGIVGATAASGAAWWARRRLA